MDQEDPLEEGIATHSSILAWRIPMDSSVAGCCPWGHKESDTTKATNHACMQHKLAEIADLIRIMTLKLVSL